MSLRSVVCGLFLAIATVSAAHADAQPFRAGITRITVQDDVPFDTAVTYPTESAEAPFQAGPFPMSAARGAPIAAGRRFPLVLFSHGNGRKKGSPLPHRDLLLHLAREGFIVVAPYHSAARQPLEVRPRQIREALESVLANPRFVTGAAPDRIGMMGFSFGGAVALVVAGAVPDFAHLSAYCRSHHDDPRACGGIPADGSLDNLIGRASPDRLPVKALVLMEPFGAVFAQKDLADVRQPTLIYRARQSDLQADGNVLALARELPKPPQEESVDGGHFIFLGPCPPVLKKEASAACKDAPGVDRAAIHTRVLQQISAFLHRAL
jgi:predicted dienelactone hydrolase